MSTLFQSLAARITALKAQILDATTAGNGAGSVGFIYATAYVGNTIGAWLKGLATSAGAGFIGWMQGGAGAQVRNLGDKLTYAVDAFDFMTAAQRADVRANTAASNLAGALDVTAAIQAAITYAASLALVGVSVYLPPGSYKISSTIYTYGAGQVGQVAIIGSGRFSTRIFPAGDFTALNLVNSYQDSCDFSIEWPATARASIPTTRVGIELASGTSQSSYTAPRNITVNYAYRGIVLNSWTAPASFTGSITGNVLTVTAGTPPTVGMAISGAGITAGTTVTGGTGPFTVTATPNVASEAMTADWPLGTAYLIELDSFTAFRCADYGVWLNSKTGSTTLIMKHVYVRADDITLAAAGKGVFINNFNDVQMDTCAVDSAVDNWVVVQNANNTVSTNLAFEGCTMVTAASVAINVNSIAALFNGIKTISCTFNTGAATNARVLSIGANTNWLTVSGYTEQANTVTTGTRYKIAINAAGSHVFILDRSVLQTDVLDNGFFANAVYEGHRRTSLNAMPNYGTWALGDVVENGAVLAGRVSKWSRLTTGSGNVLATDWLAGPNF